MSPTPTPNKPSVWSSLTAEGKVLEFAGRSLGNSHLTPPLRGGSTNCSGLKGRNTFFFSCSSIQNRFSKPGDLGKQRVSEEGVVSGCKNSVLLIG